MFKLVIVAAVLICFNEANIQLVVPDESYTILKGDKSFSNLANSLPLSNDLSEEDKSSPGILEESKEAVASSTAAAPASLTRTKPSSISSSITSSSGVPAGVSRPSLVISSSAQASATGSVSSSARSSTTIQHRILPAETIPLPITISTRPGLRTVIAPETITIQQPTIAQLGEVVQQIPTAVSHQRQTVVHNHARVVTPIVGPAIRTVTSQIVRAYHTPLVYAPQISAINVSEN